MTNDLPEFQNVSQRFAAEFINAALSGPRGASLLKLQRYEDHHFRAIFRLSYFDLRPGASQPSKSQWNTLKKRLKRRDRRVFVFRKYGRFHGRLAGLPRDEACLYLDFGFRAW